MDAYQHCLAVSMIWASTVGSRLAPPPVYRTTVGPKIGTRFTCLEPRGSRFTYLEPIGIHRYRSDLVRLLCVCCQPGFSAALYTWESQACNLGVPRKKILNAFNKSRVWIFVTSELSTVVTMLPTGSKGSSRLVILGLACETRKPARSQPLLI